MLKFWCNQKKGVRYVLNKLNKNIKNLDMWDMACTKLAVMFFVMFLFVAWPNFQKFTLSIGPFVLFVGWVIFAIRPLSRFFSK